MDLLVNALAGKKTYLGLILMALGAAGVQTDMDELMGVAEAVDTIVTAGGFLLAVFEIGKEILLH